MYLKLLVNMAQMSRTDLRISTLVAISRIALWRRAYLHALTANGSGTPEFCPDCASLKNDRSFDADLCLYRQLQRDHIPADVNGEWWPQRPRAMAQLGEN